MNQDEFLKPFQKLCITYNKQIDEDLINIYFEVVKDQRPDYFKNGVDLYIYDTESKFFPKPSELLEFCYKARVKAQKEIVAYMESKGYFKSPRELDKTIYYVSCHRDCVPAWLKEDMNKYYKMMVNENCFRLGQPQKYNLLEGVKEETNQECFDISGFFA